MTSHGRWQTGLALLASLWAPAAFAVNSGRVEYYHRDALGNVRVVTDESGQVIERHDYLPFGEECTTGACATNPGVGTGQPLKFTGKERDAETGLDYFVARYYSQRVGRFTTIDPVYTWNENLHDPQRWNRYAYGRNNPLRYVDPDGRVIETPWDALNVAMGAASFGANVASGNLGGAALDAAGLIYDITATAAPGLPAGASSTIGAARAARAADRAGDVARALQHSGDEVTAAAGIVYKRTNPKTGAEYVGRSKSEAAFLDRQSAHDRKLGTKHKYEIVDRATPGEPLRVAEESAIRTRGGPGPLDNKRYEMNDAAYRGCGGTCDKPRP